MKYLFLFAHPDDETVGSAVTIKRLTDLGEAVYVISATDGSAGKAHERVSEALKKQRSLGKLRLQEFNEVASFLGVKEARILDFVDGGITNQQVWGKLTQAFTAEIDRIQPDFVITFDHTGWYYHLDHVGVSIAATLAVQQATHTPDVFLLSHHAVSAGKWKYIFSDVLPITHTVSVAKHTEFKNQAIDMHRSQDLSSIKKRIADGNHTELYQLAFATPKGESYLGNHPVFESSTPIKR